MSFRRLADTVGALVSVLALACACSGAPRPAGDPDPGHQSLSGLEPVLSVIPAGARVIHEDRVEPRWDSCDGEQSTYGWDPAVVDADFSTGAAPWQQVVVYVRAAMRRLGWAYDPKGSGGGQLMWSRKISGRTATTTLLMPGDPPTWTLDAEAPPATHPVTAC
jgi:hypothetical protein